MKTLKTILVPTDFSENAEHALVYAIDFAKSLEAKLVLLHTYHMPVATTEISYDVGNIFFDNVLQEVKDGFADLERRILIPSGIIYKCIEKMGFASDEIKSAIDAFKIDMIIMESKGVRGLETFLGSVTSNTIQRVSCPVLVIPAKATFSPIKKIVFAYDYKTIGDEAVLEPLVLLAKSFNAEVEVLYVSEDLDELEAEQVVAGVQLNHCLSSVKHQFRFKTHAAIDVGIEDYLMTHQSDILAVMPRKHSLFERIFQKSISKELIFHTQIPLFAFHG